MALQYFRRTMTKGEFEATFYKEDEERVFKTTVYKYRTKTGKYMERDFGEGIKLVAEKLISEREVELTMPVKVFVEMADEKMQ